MSKALSSFAFILGSFLFSRVQAFLHPQKNNSRRITLHFIRERRRRNNTMRRTGQVFVSPVLSSTRFGARGKSLACNIDTKRSFLFKDRSFSASSGFSSSRNYPVSTNTLKSNVYTRDFYRTSTTLLDMTSTTTETLLAPTITENKKYPNNLTNDSILSTNPYKKKKKPIEISPINPHYNILFAFELPQGICIGVSLCESDNVDDLWEAKYADILHPDEISFLVTQNQNIAQGKNSLTTNQISFLVGRIAMRTAIHHLEQKKDDSSLRMSTTKINKLPPILKEKDTGRPLVPNDFIGSISHKDDIGVALISTKSDDDMMIGVDIEKTYKSSKRKTNIAKRVLTPNEIQYISDSLLNSEGSNDDTATTIEAQESDQVLLRFSFKESLYKAIHPFVKRYVGFREAEITPYSNGTAVVKYFLKDDEKGTRIPTFRLTQAHWNHVLNDEYFITSISVVPDGEEEDHT